jgi:hypothetical protein
LLFPEVMLYFGSNNTFNFQQSGAVTFFEGNDFHIHTTPLRSASGCDVPNNMTDKFQPSSGGSALFVETERLHLSQSVQVGENLINAKGHCPQ